MGIPILWKMSWATKGTINIGNQDMIKYGIGSLQLWCSSIHTVIQFDLSLRHSAKITLSTHSVTRCFADIDTDLWWRFAFWECALCNNHVSSPTGFGSVCCWNGKHNPDWLSFKFHQRYFFFLAMLEAIRSFTSCIDSLRHRSESTLAQVMAWCLTAPSHYLNRYCRFMSEALRHSTSEQFLMEYPQYWLVLWVWKSYFIIIAESYRGQWASGRFEWNFG